MAERNGNGAAAERPREIPARGWLDIAKRSWKEAGDDNLGLVSAGVAFYGFLALVPLLAAFVLSYGLIADPAAVGEHVRALSQLLPEQAAELIGEQMVNLTSDAGDKKGFGLLIALALAIYGAMKGAMAIMTALTIVYEEEDTRGFVSRYLTALAITVGAVLIGLIGMGAVLVLGLLDNLMPGSRPFLHGIIRIGFWIMAAAAASFAVAALYRYGPNRSRAKWRWVTPGSLVATAGWLAATLLFALYTANFGSYNATYGALGAVVVLLMWLYISAYVLLLGAEFNSEIEHQTGADTTSGPAQPRGERGAEMADRPPAGAPGRGTNTA